MKLPMRSTNPGLHYAYVILLTGVLTVMGALGLARFAYTTILPSMKADLLLNNAQMGFIATGNLVGYTVFSLLGGYLAARFGPRLVIAFSLFLAGVTMFLTGIMATGFFSAVMLRFLTGLGSAGSNIPMMGLVSAWFAPRRRGTAAGVLVGGSGLGLMLTGFLVPLMINAYPQNGWRLSWFILGGIVALLGFVSYAFLRNNPREKRLNAICAPSEAAAAPGNRPSGAGFSCRRVYTSPQLWHLGLIYLFFGFSYIIYGTFFSIALISDRVYTQAQAGQLWSMIGIIGISSGIIWGLLSDLIGRKYALSIVFALQAACYYLFATAQTPGGIYISALLYGLTAFSIPGIVAATCGDYVGPRLAPAALGMVTLFFAVGQATAPSAAGILADASRSFSGPFFLAAAVAAIGSLLSLTLASKSGGIFHD